MSIKPRSAKMMPTSHELVDDEGLFPHSLEEGEFLNPHHEQHHDHHHRHPHDSHHLNDTLIAEEQEHQTDTEIKQGLRLIEEGKKIVEEAERKRMFSAILSENTLEHQGAYYPGINTNGMRFTSSPFMPSSSSFLSSSFNRRHQLAGQHSARGVVSPSSPSTKTASSTATTAASGRPSLEQHALLLSTPKKPTTTTSAASTRSPLSPPQRTSASYPNRSMAPRASPRPSSAAAAPSPRNYPSSSFYYPHRTMMASPDMYLHHHYDDDHRQTTAGYFNAMAPPPSYYR